MKKKKTIFPVLFFLVVLHSILFSLPVSAEDAVESEEINYTALFKMLQNRSGGVTITAYNGTEKNVIIPETIGGQPVTIIGNRAFFRKDISAVTIPGTVVTIEPLAFSENQLQSVVISGCVTIGYEAFAGNQLTELVLSEKLSSIGPRAFLNNNLSSITLPGKITNIGRDAFSNNPLSAITVGAKRNLFPSQGFEPSFVNYYISMGRSAGVYVKEDQIWMLQQKMPVESDLQDIDSLKK